MEQQLSKYTKCGIFPYSINEHSELVLLMRRDKKSLNPNLYLDFGGSLLPQDPSIFFTATRAFSEHSLNCFYPHDVDTAEDYALIEKILKNEEKLETFEHPAIQPLLKELLCNYHRTHKFTCDSYIAFFLPFAAYFSVETLNKAVAQNDASATLSFHWIPLSCFLEEEFCQNISAFNFQVIANVAVDLCNFEFADANSTIWQETDKGFPPTQHGAIRKEYSVLLCEDLPHWENIH